MHRGLLAAVAALGLAGMASAAPVTVLDEGYAAFNGYGLPGGGTWGSVSKDTTTAFSGSASMKIDSRVSAEPYFHCRAALDTGIAANTVDPASAQVTFAYKLDRDGGGNHNVSVGFHWGDWGYLSNGMTLTGSASLIGDNTWRTATINYTAWNKVPAAGEQLDWINVQGGWDTTRVVLNIDQVTFTSPVPEPAALSLLAVGGLLALRRRSA